MTFEGGRDTEKDLFGCFGGYKTRLIKILSASTGKYAGIRLKKRHIWAAASITARDARRYSRRHINLKTYCF
jgi:formamidopyrimidine-DNA glycosylase